MASNTDNVESLRENAESLLMNHLVVIEDFPKPTIRYLDFYRTFDLNPAVRNAVIECFLERYKNLRIDGIAAIGTGGYTFGALLAHEMNLPMYPIRKYTDTVYNAYRCKSGMIYAETELSFSKDVLVSGKRLVLVDDTIATGGTFSAAIEVLTQAGAEIVEAAAVFETSSKNGRQKLRPLPVFAVVTRENY